MVQEVGVNSFSYRDLAKQLSISSPSIHHHFPTKNDLVSAVTSRYREAFNARRDDIEAATARGRIEAYAALFAETSARQLMCICGSVAGDWLTVGEGARSEVLQFFDEQVAWLTTELETGSTAKEFVFNAAARDCAIAILAALEGSLLVARASGETLLPESVGTTLIALIVSPA